MGHRRNECPTKTSIAINTPDNKRSISLFFLELVTAGSEYGLGFITKINRACVSLSRARFGLVIL